MAFDFTKADQGIVQIPFKGKQYGLNKAGTLFVDGKPQQVPAAEWNEFLEAYDKKFMEFASKKTTDATHIGLARDTLGAVAQNSAHHPHIEDSYKLLQGVHALETELQQIPAGQEAGEQVLRNLKKIQIANPDASNIIHSSAHNRIHMDEITDARGIKKRVIDSAKLERELADLRVGTDKLAALYTKGGYVEKDVERIFLGHHPDLPHVLPDDIANAFSGGKIADYGVAASAPLNAATVGSNALRVAEGHATDVLAKAKDILSIQKKLNAKPQPWIKSGLEKDLAKKITEFSGLTSQHPDSARVIHDTLKRELTESQFTDFNRIPKVSTTMGSLGKAAESAGSAVSAAAKEGRGFWAKLFDFKNSPERIKELAQKNNKTIQEIETELGDKVGKIRMGKAVGAGALVIGSVVAAISMFGGKKEEQSNFAAREDERRMAGAGAAPAR